MLMQTAVTPSRTVRNRADRRLIMELFDWLTAGLLEQITTEFKAPFVASRAGQAHFRLALL